MGLGNRCKEIMNSAPGVGPVPLGGAVEGFTVWADHYGDGDPVEYWLVNGMNFEHGYGMFSAGTPDEISRDNILETLVGGVYDDSSPVALDLPDTATIYNAPSEEQRRNLPSPYIDGYTEAGNDVGLITSGGVITIPVDGRYYFASLGVDALLALSDVPPAPVVASVEIDLIQGGTGGTAVTYPASWLWPDGTPVEVSLDPNARTRLVISTAPDGAVHADGSVRAAV